MEGGLHERESVLAFAYFWLEIFLDFSFLVKLGYKTVKVSYGSKFLMTIIFFPLVSTKI